MSTDARRPPVILMADDDEDDRLLVREAIAEARLPGEFRCVPDGEHLLAYLYQRDQYADTARAPRPVVILLDLNMPRMDGREALRRIRAEPSFRAIPVIVMTTSHAPADVTRGYELGANTVIAKPASFAALVDVMRALGRYWFDIAELPPTPDKP